MKLPTLALLSTVILCPGNPASTAAAFQATGNLPTGKHDALHLYPVRDDSSSQKKATSPTQASRAEKQKPSLSDQPQQQPKAKGKDLITDKRRAGTLDTQPAEKEQPNTLVRDQSTARNEISQELSALRSSLQEATRQIDELERQYAASNLEYVKQRTSELEQQLGAKDQEIAALRSAVEDHSKLKSDLAAQTEQFTHATVRIADLEQQLAGKDQALTQVKDDIRLATQKIEELTPQLTARTEELAQAKQSLTDLERKLSKQVDAARASETDSGDSSPSAELSPDLDLSVTNLFPHKPTRTDLPDVTGNELAKVGEALSTKLADDIKKGRVALEQRRNMLTLTLGSGELFASGEAAITPGGASLIEQIGTLLQHFSYHSIEVAGHTDNIPVRNDPQRTFRDNGELSQARAEHASQALINGGVEGDRVKAVGYADTRPIATNETRKGRNKNRRVEIVITSSALAAPSAPVLSQGGKKSGQPVSLSSPRRP